MTNTAAIDAVSAAAFEFEQQAMPFFNDGDREGIKYLAATVREAFIAGAEWQREHQDDYDAFNGRLGPSDDAWRATLQATINQQAEELERLSEAERRLITMVKVGTGAA